LLSVNRREGLGRLDLDDRPIRGSHRSVDRRD